MRRVAVGLFSAVLSLVVSPAPAQTPPPSLMQLEAAARANASAVQLRKGETRAAMAEKDAAQASMGARVIGGLGVSDTREPVTADTARQYRRASASVGVRWPLLGSRLAQLREVDAAQWQETRARLRESIAAETSVRELRLAVVQAAAATERAAVADTYLKSQANLESQVQERQRRGATLTAELMEMTASSRGVEVMRMRQRQAVREAHQVVRRLTGYSGDTTGGMPNWPENCTDRSRLLSGDGRGRETLADLDIAAAQAQLDLIGDSIVQTMDAGVQVIHAQSQDFPGRSGHSTGVSLDVSIPMQWQKVRQSRRAQWLERKRVAQESADMERALREEEVDKALAERELLRAELDHQQKGLVAAREGLRVALLRLPAMDGDGYAKVWAARHAVYAAALKVVDVKERLQTQSVELMALGPACMTASVYPDPVAGAQPLAVSELALSAPERPQPTIAGAETKRLGWFVWDGATLLKDPQRVDGIAADSDRLLLSFKAKEIEGLNADAWSSLRQRVSDRQLRLDLLLGDPDWVTPAGRAALLKLLRQVRDWPVQGVGLDIERSQLRKPMTAEAWQQEVLETLRAVRSAVPWPVSLITHHRDVRQPQFLRDLKTAGVDEVIAMIYTTREATARATVEGLLAAAPAGLTITLAQSIEPVLPAEESSFKRGRSASVASWQRLTSALSADPRFGGLIVQSLADYEKARP